MTDDNPISGITGPKLPVVPTKAGQESAAAQAVEKKNDEFGTQEFLTLLVNQLQHQDPLNPMSNEEFAVQLAQFSQLDELISIREAVQGGGSADVNGANPVASMASYLGHEVVLGGDQLASKNSNLLFDVPGGTQSVRIDLSDENGALIGRFALEDVDAGRQVVPLNQYQLAEGKFDVRVVSVDSDGRFVDLDTKVTGTVEGFVLEPEPRLLIGGQEVALDEIIEVHQGES
jgi:flagellar basal-body rod modification protein FlgD